MSIARVVLVILACVVLGACSGKPLADPATSVVFDGQSTYQPGSPAIGDLITLSFTLIDNTTDGTAISGGMPYQVSLDGAVIANGTTAAIDANSTVVTTSVIQISTAGQHTVVITLDPAGTTGFVDASANAQTLLITVAPSASG